MEASCVWTFRSNGGELGHRAGGMLWALGYDPLGVVVETWLITNDRLVGVQRSQTSRLYTEYAPIMDLMQPLTWYWVIAKPGPWPLNQSKFGSMQKSHASGDFKKLDIGRCLGLTRLLIYKDNLSSRSHSVTGWVDDSHGPVSGKGGW